MSKNLKGTNYFIIFNISVLILFLFICIFTIGFGFYELNKIKSSDNLDKNTKELFVNNVGYKDENYYILNKENISDKEKNDFYEILNLIEENVLYTKYNLIIAIIIFGIISSIVNMYYFSLLKNKSKGYFYLKIPVSRNQYYFIISVFQNFCILISFLILNLFINYFSRSINIIYSFYDISYFNYFIFKLFLILLMYNNFLFLINSLIKNNYISFVVSVIPFIFFRNFSLYQIIIITLIGYFVFKKASFLSGNKFLNVVWRD